MTANTRDELVQNTSDSAKRVWVAPRIENAPARAADGSLSGSSADYGIYS